MDILPFYWLNLVVLFFALYFIYSAWALAHSKMKETLSIFIIALVCLSLANFTRFSQFYWDLPELEIWAFTIFLLGFCLLACTSYRIGKRYIELVKDRIDGKI